MSGINLARRIQSLLPALFPAAPGLWQNRRTRAQMLSSAGLLAGIGAGLASYAIWREPLHVRLDRLEICLPNAASHLPAAGLRILHLSDTHFRGTNWREFAKIDCIRKACAGLEYDLLIHTGDFLHHDSGLPNVLTLLDALPAPRLGGYAVFGNHDYSTYSHSGMLTRAWSNFQMVQHCEPVAQPVTTTGAGATQSGANAYRVNGHGANAHRANGRGSMLSHARTLYEFSQFCANSPLDLKRTGRNNTSALEVALAARNITTLHNRCVRLTHPELGLDLYLAGVDDMVEGTPELGRALCDIPYDAPTILLSHNPDILTEPGIEQADLVLAGHTHGGQIVLPLLGAAHTQSIHLGRKEVSGYLRRGKTQVYITRGVGEGIPVRFGAQPQVTLITVLPDRAM